MYVKPWMKYGGLYCGVTLAYIHHQTDYLQRAHKRQWVIGLLFLIAVGMLLFSLIPYPFTVPEKGFAFTAMYFVCWRLFISIAVSLLIFCSLGESWLGGAIGWVFKWRVWYPLAQLAYSAFIVHPMLLAVSYNPSILPFQVQLQLARQLFSVHGSGCLQLHSVLYRCHDDRVHRVVLFDRGSLLQLASWASEEPPRAQEIEAVRGVWAFGDGSDLIVKVHQRSHIRCHSWSS